MILMNDFKAEPAELQAAMGAAAQRVIASGWYVLGPEVTAFEQRWAAYLGARAAVGVGNGMDAIELALRGLGIGAGDEVITTPMTAFATVLAILRAGAVPVLADIDPETALLDPHSVRRCIGPRTRALIPVHLYGQLRDPQTWVDLCAEAGIELVEDCAQAHGARWDGRAAGTFGHAGAYSFYPTKNLGAPGDGGALVTDDEALAALVSRLRNYGQSERYIHPEIGMNSRLDEMHAAILSVRLEWLARYTERRRAIALAYDRSIRNDSVRLLAPPQQPQSHVHHLYVVCCTARTELQQHLKDHGVQTLLHYPVPVHRQDSVRDIRRDPQGLAAAERHAAECLSLPCHPQVSDDQVAQVIDVVNGFRPAAR
jgi:dTDP-4-amino-4,6-dideoxygalactose transaminase